MHRQLPKAKISRSETGSPEIPIIRVGNSNFAFCLCFPTRLSYVLSGRYSSSLVPDISDMPEAAKGKGKRVEVLGRRLISDL